MKISIGEDLMKKYGAWVRRIYLKPTDILISLEQDPEYSHSIIVLYRSKEGRTGAFTVFKVNYDIMLENPS